MQSKNKFFIAFILYLPLLASAIELEVGDLVFRKDSSLVSHLFSLAGKFKDNRFSHVGIVANISPVEIWHVYDRGRNALQKESFEEFAKESTDLGFYRLKKIDREKLKVEFGRYRERIIIFDYQFKQNNNKLYCSEFIYELLKLSNASIDNNLQVVTLGDLVENAEKIQIR